MTTPTILEAKQRIIGELRKHPDQPLIASELAHATRTEPTTVRRTCSELVSDGVVSARNEDPVERAIRFGGRAPGGAAMLYSVGNYVPARTERIVVDGYTTNRGAKSRVGKNNVNRRLASVISSKSGNWQFNAGLLTRLAKVSNDPVYRRIRFWSESGWIKCTNNKQRNQVFRITNRKAILASLGHPDPEPESTSPAPTPVDRDDTVLVKKAELTAAKALMDQLREDNERLREENERLRRAPRTTVVSLSEMLS